MQNVQANGDRVRDTLGGAIGVVRVKVKSSEVNGVGYARICRRYTCLISEKVRIASDVAGYESPNSTVDISVRIHAKVR